MGKNYMPEVARMLGVEIDEEFDLLNEGGEVIDYSPYKFTSKVIVDCYDAEINSSVFFELLIGKYTIQKRPWRPKEGDVYWFIDADGFADWGYFCKDSLGAICDLNMGNCFPTKEAAEAAVPEMLAKFEEIRKGVRE